MLKTLRTRAVLAVLPFLLLAQIALADPLSDRYKITDKLGSGAFKDVYAVEGHPELAIGLFERNQNGGWGNKDNLLQEEKDMLDRVAAVGVPTATILEISTYEGKKAYLQKRFETANRAPDYQQKRWEVLNQTSIDDCHKIEAAFVAGHLDVSDAQFLIGKDGHVVLNDPLSISVLNGAQSSAKYVLDQIEREAREAIAARDTKLLATLPETTDPVLAAYFARATVALAAGDAAGEAALKEALLHYLETGPTTPRAEAVAKAIRDGTFEVEFLHGTAAPSKANGVGVKLDEPFPKLAADLVREGIMKIEAAIGTFEAEVSGFAHAFDFLDRKGVPDGLVKGPELKDPSALVKALEARHGAVDDATRAHLEGVAARIRNRGVTPGDPVAPRSTGLSGVLDHAIDDAAHPVAADGR